MKCNTCDGTGYVVTEPARMGPSPEPAEYGECPACEARGVVDGAADETVDVVVKLNLTDIRSAATAQAVQRVMGGEYNNLRSDVKDAALKEIRPQIEAEVRDILREVLAEPINLTDQWGGQKGETTTLREIIMGEARQFINRKPEKDYRGKVTRRGLNGLMYEQVKDLFSTELRKDLEEAKKALKGKINKRLGEEFAKVVAEMIR